MNPKIGLLMGVFSFILCTTITSGEQIQSLIPEEVQKQILNYPGCKTWEQHICIECSYRFYFDLNGVCKQVSDYCRTFNRQMGYCQTCYEGYEINDGKCSLKDLLAPENIGCRTWKDNICRQCSFRYYFDEEKICRQVSDFCRTWNDQGLCLTCYGGYTLKDGACILDSSRLPGGKQQLCAVFQENICVKCAFRAYENEEGICTEVDPYCKTWDQKDGFCLSCYKGYQLEDGKCIWPKGNIQSPPDTGCREWDWDELVCLECSLGYAKQDGVCVLIYSEDGTGLTSDYHCRKVEGQQCIECAFRYFLNEDKVCEKVSDLCQEWDTKGDCTSCYSEYYLHQGSCLLRNKEEITSEINSQEKQTKETGDGESVDIGEETRPDESYSIPLVIEGQNPSEGCHKIGENNVCIQCAFRFYLNSDKICEKVSDLCATWNQQGNCESCYIGHYLQDGSCFQDSQMRKGSYPLCKIYDEEKEACVQCEGRAYLKQEGICAQVEQNCKTWDKEGSCLSCFGGFDLKGKECLWSASVIPPPNQGCASWDWDNLKCNLCMEDYVRVDNLCVSIYDKCLIAYDDLTCISCSLGFRTNQEGRCVLGNPLCRVEDSEGSCTSCYSGFLVINQKCIPISKLAEIEIFYTSLQLIQH